MQYNQRQAAKEQNDLLAENAVVFSKTPEPRSYLIEIDSNAAVRRKRRQLTPNPKDTAVPPVVNPSGQVPGAVEKARESVPRPNSEIPVTSTRSGRRVIPPKNKDFI